MVSSSYFKSQINFINTTRIDQITQAVTVLKASSSYMTGLSAAVICIFVVALFTSARILTARVLVSITFTFINNIFIAFGALFTGVGVYIAVKNNASLAGMVQVLGLLITLGVLFIIISIIGHCGHSRKNFAVIMLFMVFTLGLLAAAAAAAYVCFLKADVITTYMEAMSDDTMGRMASALGVSMGKLDIMIFVQTNLKTIGLGFAIMTILQVVVFIAAGFFIMAVKQWREENGVSDVGGRWRRREKGDK